MDACKHLTDKPDLEILWTLDAHLQFADGYTRCKHCDAHYLVEMIDLLGNDAAFRVSRLPSDYVEKTVKSLRKGSCDINRARDEAFNMKSVSSRLQLVLIRRDGEFEETVPVEARIPQESWRALPCDGSWLSARKR